MISREALAAVCAAALLLAGAPARSESEAERVVRKMDETLTAGDDQYFVWEMITKEQGKPDRKLLFEVTIKGSEWRRIELLAPGDVKGIRYLVRSLTQMYVYLPAYRKVRRVASHVKDQSFMGSAMNQDEMAITVYGEANTVKMIEQTDRYWRVEFNEQPNKEFPYPRMVIDIDKKYYQPILLKYFNDRGMHIKTETRRDFHCIGEICHAKVMHMIDHRRNDIATTMLEKDWQVNTGTPDSFFSVRSLQRRGKKRR